MSFYVITFDIYLCNMAKREYIQRHLLIIKRLKSTASTFEDVHNYLLNQQEITGDNFDISQRTFQRDIKEIDSIYGIEIKHNKKEGWYEITDEIEEKPFERIIEAFETLSALNFSNQVSTKLILEKRGNKGTEHMHGLLYAIENNFEIIIKHQSYWKEDPEIRKLQPIAIKESNNRWYLICFDTVKKDFRNFGLDRIQNLEITSLKFKSIDYNVTTYYQHAFGIETYEPVTKVVLNFSAFQAQYIKSLPLHLSQKVIFEDANNCKFEYFMHPTNDFLMEIMKYGENVVILEPKSLRKNVKNKIITMLSLYK